MAERGARVLVLARERLFRAPVRGEYLTSWALQNRVAGVQVGGRGHHFGLGQADEQSGRANVDLFGEADLRRVLKSYASYYNRVRTHLALNKNSPLFRRRQTVGNIVSFPILGRSPSSVCSSLSFPVMTALGIRYTTEI